MKKILSISILLAVSVALCAFSGCQTTAGTAQTPAQVAAQVCPPVESGLAALQAAGLSDTDTAALAKITPLVTAACSSTAAVNFTNLQTLGSTGFPAVQALIQASSLPADTKKKATTDLIAVQIIFDMVLAADPAAAAIVVAPTK